MVPKPCVLLYNPFIWDSTLYLAICWLEQISGRYMMWGLSYMRNSFILYAR